MMGTGRRLEEQPEILPLGFPTVKTGGEPLRQLVLFNPSNSWEVGRTWSLGKVLESLLAFHYQ